MSAYFEQVYLQQTPDYAYGEEIAVRRSSARLSLASSYRVFAARLLSGDPPWLREVGTGDVAVTITEPSLSPKPSVVATSESKVVLRALEESRDVPKEGRPKVFLSYARENHERVAHIARAFESDGFDVWWNRDIPPGVEYERTVTAALDNSDVVVVFWSLASIASEAVLAETGCPSMNGSLQFDCH